MESTRGLPLEVRLSAYLDGQISEAEKQEIDDILARDDDAREVFERLKLGSELGARAFDDMLNEPVPLDLVRGIKQASGDDTVSTAGLAALAPPSATVSRWPRALAASLCLFIAGGAAGYLLAGRQDAATTPVQLVAARSWLDDVADYHRVYSRQDRHLAEVPASEREHIVEWLSSSTGVDFRLPDLSGQNLTFEGARLLVAAGAPTAQLLYSNEDGDIFAICFLSSAPVDAPTPLNDSMRGDIGLVSWQRGAASYVVVGPSADPGLERLAETVAASI